MARPQKYTDSDIWAAIQVLVAEGEEINPMRVRMRLGGGNIGRIKAIIAERSVELVLQDGLPAQMPEALARDFQRFSADASQQLLSLAVKCWSEAWAASQGAQRDEIPRLGKQIDGLERRLKASTDLLAELEGQRDEKNRALAVAQRERTELAQNYATMQSALRNAESDLRAGQKMIAAFERNQQQDRQEIRSLQERIEGLVAELAALKAQKAVSPTTRNSSSRKKSD